eukprot:gene17202-biopygen2310
MCAQVVRLSCGPWHPPRRGCISHKVLAPGAVVNSLQRNASVPHAKLASPPPDPQMLFTFLLCSWRRITKKATPGPMTLVLPSQDGFPMHPPSYKRHSLTAVSREKEIRAAPGLNNPCPFFFPNGTTLLFDRQSV